MLKSKQEITFVPPKSVSKLAGKGLKLRQKTGHGGTAVGLARAQQLNQQKALGVSEIKKMVSYFARHTVDKKAKNFGDNSNPSKGYIAWLLWGGDEGQKWVEGLKKANYHK